MAKKSNKVIKYKRNRRINVGVIIFVLLFIYLLIYVGIYFSKERVSTYEVESGNLVQHNTYTGVAIRDETIISSDGQGFINYYADQGMKIDPKSLVYTLSGNKNAYKDITSQMSNDRFYTETNETKLIKQLDDYSLSYNNNQFNSLYEFEDDLKGQVMSLAVDETSSSVNDEGTAKYGMSTGIISYKIDDLSGLSQDNITEDIFDVDKHESMNLKVKTSVSSGDAVYKVITNELWEICIKPDADFLSKIEDNDYVKIKFLRDNETAFVACHKKTVENTTYVILELNSSMVRYSDLRYINLEIIQDETSGLKIPNSALVTKTFNLIPKAYLVLGNNDTQWGFMTKAKDEQGQEILSFIAATVYNKDDDYCYVQDKDIAQGDTVVDKQGAKPYLVKETSKLTGVYGVNKSYIEFKMINILHKGEVYSIIDDHTSYGITMYDHIALESNKVTEGQIIH